MCPPAERRQLRRARRRVHQGRGFGLIELLVAVAIVGLLLTIALPGFQAQIRKSRRADGIAAILRVQQLQERYRALQPAYAASLGTGGLGQPTRSQAGHYELSSTAASGAESTGYTVQARAIGAQQDDAACRYLVLQVEGGRHSTRSGDTVDVGNSSAANEACWGQ